MSTPISALQRNAAEVVRRVAASGIAEEITDRGRVVAVIAPPPEETGLERLRRMGAVREAKPGALREWLELNPEIAIPGLTKALEEQRDTER
jgi:prevent-host-death family protein